MRRRRKTQQYVFF